MIGYATIAPRRCMPFVAACEWCAYSAYRISVTAPPRERVTLSHPHQLPAFCSTIKSRRHWGWDATHDWVWLHPHPRSTLQALQVGLQGRLCPNSLAVTCLRTRCPIPMVSADERNDFGSIDAIPVPLDKWMVIDAP